MKTFAAALLVFGVLVLLGCQKQDEVPVPAQQTNAATPSSSGSSILSMPADYVGTAVKVKSAATRTVDTASVNQAIQLFHAQEGRYPKDLNELVSERYLTRVPSAPTGMRLEYNPAKGQARMVPEK
jgi:hypothetical protein